MEEINGYKLSRNWFDFCFENPEKIKPNHTALYFFIIEHCNRLGWKKKFGLPMEMAKDAIGIKNYRTYSNTFNELIEWGFIKIIQKSKNQYSSNIIAIVENTKANTKALDKAIQKHSQKQGQKQYKSIVGIDKHITIEPITLKQKIIKKNKKLFYQNKEEFKEVLKTYSDKYNKLMINEFYSYWIEPDVDGKMKMNKEKTWSLDRRLSKWHDNDYNKHKNTKEVKIEKAHPNAIKIQEENDEIMKEVMGF